MERYPSGDLVQQGEHFIDTAIYGQRICHAIVLDTTKGTNKYTYDGSRG